ncbi:MAG: M20/M25/M40 family metallo-hydrolase [Pirellulales bacterium]|nr:M20/M25/M40 family metallo-hydrolase [Pirellulales bacterium]
MSRVSTSVPNGLLPDVQATKILMRLLAIPGLSGAESKVVDFLRQELSQAGVAASALKIDSANRRSSLGGETGNLVLRLPGNIRAPRRLLVAHMDTVPVCQGARPVQRGRRIESKDKDTGLGADNRSGVGVLLTTALSILRNNIPHPPLTLLWTVQEEVGLHGARHVRLGLLGKPKLAFNWDGGAANSLKIGATGGYRMDIEISGIASHAGGHPEQGVSAIAIASLAIADLVNNGWHGLIEKGSQCGTSNIGVIRGGEATNVVTESVYLRAEARSHNSKFRERIVREIEKAFRKATKQIRNSAGKLGSIQFSGQLDYESFRLPLKDPSVVAASQAIKSEGCKPDLGIVNGGLDANWLTAHGIPTVTLGCGQNSIHTVKEWLDLEEFHQARRIAMRLVTEVK